jgi:hypothetical protein
MALLSYNFIYIYIYIYIYILPQDVTAGHAPSLEEERAVFVDRGVGSPKFARSTNEIFSMSNIKLDSEAKVVWHSNT